MFLPKLVEEFRPVFTGGLLALHKDIKTLLSGKMTTTTEATVTVLLTPGAQSVGSKRQDITTTKKSLLEHQFHSLNNKDI